LILHASLSDVIVTVRWPEQSQLPVSEPASNRAAVVQVGDRQLGLPPKCPSHLDGTTPNFSNQIFGSPTAACRSDLGPAAIDNTITRLVRTVAARETS